LNANGTLNVTPVAAIFTVAGDMTATYFRGVRIKFTQTTVKYGYVNSSSYSAGTGLTTVTLIANAGYQMGLSSGVAITLPSFSFGAPAGFPEKLAYIGASVPASGAFTTITSTLAFTMFGRTCMVIGSVAMTNVGTGVGSLTVTAPFAASTNNNVGSGREVNATGVQLSVWYNGNINVGKYDATGAVFTGWSDLFAFTYQ
jgi:phage tail protein X